MVRTLTRRYSVQSSRSFHISRMPDNSGRQQQNLIPDGNDVEDVDDNLQSRSIGTRNAEDQSMEHQNVGESGPDTPQERQQSDMELMRERFAKLLLGEDMSGGKGVSSALALSNAVTNPAECTLTDDYGHKTKERSACEYTWPVQTRHIAYCRRLLTTLDKKNNFGMCSKMMIKRKKTARGMTNGGIQLLRFQQMGYQKNREDG
ncbi:hypothetical protein CRYUN_Cryun03dG0003100 [Craigia yunnanensis]